MTKQRNPKGITRGALLKKTERLMRENERLAALVQQHAFKPPVTAFRNEVRSLRVEICALNELVNLLRVEVAARDAAVIRLKVQLGLAESDDSRPF